MHLGPWKYLLVYLVPAVVVVGLFAGGWWTIAGPLAIFGLVPLLELGIGGSDANAPDEVVAGRLDNRAYDLVLYLALPVQLAVLGSLLYVVATGALTGWALVGGVASVAMSCGGLGINVAHELGHRRSRREQLLAKLLLVTSFYVHFFVEHNRGHHARVATDDDPASSRRGEWLYAFWVRSLVMGWISAWKLEAKRLRARKLSVASVRHNEVLRWQLVQLAAVAGVALFVSPLGALLVVVAGIGGGLLLETVNYVEHYGLRRQRTARGHYERVRPVHSWNSNDAIGRLLLFELTRHSDHHANPKRHYPALRHFDEAPELPTGYPGMMVLSTIPPLFFAVMHRRLEQWGGEPAAAAVA